MKKYSTHIIWAVVVIVALAGGFFWGKSTVAARTGYAGAVGSASGTRGGFGGARAGGAAAGGFVSGQIISTASGSLTVQLANGNSEVVYYSTSTQVIKPTPASVSDLTPGTMVMIAGTTDASGVVTAQSIQVRQGSANGTAPAASQ